MKSEREKIYLREKYREEWEKKFRWEKNIEKKILKGLNVQKKFSWLKKSVITFGDKKEFCQKNVAKNDNFAM